MSSPHVSRLFVVTLTALALRFISPVEATVAPPGVTVVPEAEPNPFNATFVLANTGLQNFMASGPTSQIAGTAQEWVVRGFAGDSFGPLALTFVYQITLAGGFTTTGAPTITALSATGFLLGLIDVGFNQAAAGQVIPGTADRSASGDMIRFNFVPLSIGVGQTSALLIINTTATTFKIGTYNVSGSGLTAAVNGFSPNAPLITVAAPDRAGTGMLLVLACAALAFCAKMQGRLAR